MSAAAVAAAVAEVHAVVAVVVVVGKSCCGSVKGVKSDWWEGCCSALGWG